MLPEQSVAKDYFKKIAPSADYWRKRNAYYYNYIDSLIAFLVPSDKRTLVIRSGDAEKLMSAEGTFDYIVLSDLIGYLSDVQTTLSRVQQLLQPRGRIVITQYNQLWEPVLNLASKLRLRKPAIPQNWLSRGDIENLLELSGFEVVKSGTKLLLPMYIPLLSAFVNNILANLPILNRLGLINFIVARPVPTAKADASVSIIVPARNEAGTIASIIQELPEMGPSTEIIFIEGNSTDDTLEVIQREITRPTGNKKLSYAVQDGKGKGDAVRKGFAMASGDILFIYDADMTVPTDELPKFYDAITHGRGDFINGSRLVYPIEKQSMRTFNWIANKFFSLAFSWLLGQRIKDTLCGTKVLWREDYQDISRNRSFFGDFDPFGDFDLLFGATKLNAKIVDLPVHYKERVYGTTNISRWRHGVLLLGMVIFAARKIKFI